jgi:hypothetical protein
LVGAVAVSRVRIYSLSAGMGKCVGFILLIPTMIRKEFADIRTTKAIIASV